MNDVQSADNEKGFGRLLRRTARLASYLLTSIIYLGVMRWDRSGWVGNAAFWSAALVLLLAPKELHAENGAIGQASARLELGAVETPTSRAAIRQIIEKETADSDLPPDIAEAVIFVESGYDPSLIGSVGEIGLMQVRPETAAMLGFRGTSAELAQPGVNIHYGVRYLSRAWRLAGGDLCRALMKYRAGHGEETMTPRSQIYCNRARNRLLAINSASTAIVTVAAPAQLPAVPAGATRNARASALEKPSKPKDVYTHYRQGTAAASRAYWAAQEASVRQIKARIEARWKRLASR